MNICFVGGGNMASALIGGLLKNNFTADQLRVVEINLDHRNKLKNKFSVYVTDQIAQGIAGSNVIVLAVKPQQLQSVAGEIAPLLSGQLLLSIAAGIRSADIARWAQCNKLVRAMPNTPALIQSGITGLYALPEVSPAQCDTAQAIMAAVGETLWLADEALMDALTAISGSGPAYVFYFMEAVQQAAVELGFDEADAQRLACQTFLGASKLAANSLEDVRELRARVTSKNGTTERALLSMESNHVRQHIINAAFAAAARSREMGIELGAAKKPGK
ncbi:MAG: pyrroline-5-carboxylate reductase [Candidatus Nitrotoga sp.]